MSDNLNFLLEHGMTMDEIHRLMEHDGLTVDQIAEASRRVVERGETLDPAAPSWEPPIPIGDMPLPDFPAHCLPADVRNYVEAVAESVQVAADMPAVAALVVGALCLQGKAVIRGKPDWFEPLNLFAVAVAPPAERKSAVLQSMTSTIYQFERDANEQNRDAIAEYQIHRNVLEKTVRELEDKVAKGKATMDAVIEARQELEALETVRPLRLLADDASPEALTSLLAENGGRMAVVSSEGGIFETLSGRYSQAVSIDTFLKAHAGDPIRVDRKGRPSEYIPHPALSVLLTIQPQVLDGLMGNAAFRGRGLCARFLYAIPTSKVGGRQFETTPIPPEVRARYEAVIYSILAIPSEDKPAVLKLSSEAYRLSAAFAAELEPRLKGDLESIGDWAGKCHGVILRIAGILHLMGQSGMESPVSVQTMESAIGIGRYFIEHAKAAYSLMGADAQTQDAKYILRQLERGQYKSISKRDLFRLCRGRFKRVEDMDRATLLLSEYGYVRSVEIERDGSGRKPSPVFDVNPILYGQNGLNGQNRAAS